MLIEISAAYIHKDYGPGKEERLGFQLQACTQKVPFGRTKLAAKKLLRKIL